MYLNGELKMSTFRAKKNFIVVAYDISDDKRRNSVMKLLEKVGKRINLSVFECMVSDTTLARLKVDIARKIDRKNDRVAIYPICIGCYSKIEYLLPEKRTFESVHVL